MKPKFDKNYLIINKKASFDYEILERYEAGLMLTGLEAKTIYEGKGSLTGSYVKELSGELFLVNSSLSPEKRSLNLLMHKKQIISLAQRINHNKLTLIPLSLYNNGRLIKLEVGLCIPKKEHNKRSTLKSRDVTRDIQRELRGKY